MAIRRRDSVHAPCRHRDPHADQRGAKAVMAAPQSECARTGGLQDDATTPQRRHRDPQADQRGAKAVMAAPQSECARTGGLQDDATTHRCAMTRPRSIAALRHPVPKETTMLRVLPWMLLALCALPTAGSASPSPEAIIVNGTPLADATREAFAQRFGYTPRSGRYWYDAATGAWGLEGQGTAGFMAPGLALGGPLRADASNGRTGVFINGRELADSDIAGLWSLGIPAQRGRWWVDAWGNAGPEGFAATFNVFAIARQSAAARGGGGGDSIWRTWGSGDNKGSTWIGSDGSLSHSTTINGKTYDYYLGD